MAIPVPSPIGAAPPVPSSLDPEATFDAQYEAFNSFERDVLVPGINAHTTNVHANAEAAETAAANAGASLDAAQTAANSAAQSAALAASGANAVPWTPTTVWQPGTPTTAPSAAYDPDYNPGLVYRYIGATAQTTGRPKDNPTLWAQIGTLPSLVGQDGKYLSVVGSALAWVSAASWANAASASADDGTDLADATRYSVISGTNRYLPNAPAIGFRVVLLDAANLFVGGTWQLRRRNAAHKINNIAQDVTFNFPQGIVTVEYAAANTWVLA